MGLIIYNLGIWFYNFLALVLAQWNKKAKLFIEGRWDIFEKIKEKLSGNNKKLVWFHCSSLGEFEQARPVIEGIKLNNPEFYIFITFFSPSGYELRKNYELADAVFYLPSDTRSNAKNLIKLINPAIVYFVKYDFWYHYLTELKRYHIPVILFSAQFRKDQLFFKNYGGFYRKMLFCFTHIFVQNALSETLLKKIGYKNITIAGDTRFDRVMENKNNIKNIEIAKSFKNNIKTMVAGSTWSEDINIIIPFINTFTHSIKAIIAPHEINEKYLLEIEQRLNKTAIRFSKATLENIKNYDILIIDNVGMLSSLYQYGDIAYIGGGFKQGLHNILEPAVFALPIIFGPEKDFQRFPEAHDLLVTEGAKSVSSALELTEIVSYLFENANYMRKMGNAAKEYIEKNIGATTKILLWRK